MSRMIAWATSMTLALLAAPALAEGPMEAGAAMPAQGEMAKPMEGEMAKPMMQGEVARALFTTGVSDREPVDQVEQVAGTSERVYFYTELRGMQGQHVMHRWEYNGQVMAEVGFDVGSGRWRVWSSKNMQPAWGGKWTVSVVSSSGEVLTSRDLQYGGQ